MQELAAGRVLMEERDMSCSQETMSPSVRVGTHLQMLCSREDGASIGSIVSAESWDGIPGRGRRVTRSGSHEASSIGFGIDESLDGQASSMVSSGEGDDYILQPWDILHLEFVTSSLALLHSFLLCTHRPVITLSNRPHFTVPSTHTILQAICIAHDLVLCLDLFICY